MGLDFLGKYNTTCKECSNSQDAYCKTCDRNYCIICDIKVHNISIHDRVFYCHFCDFKESMILCKTCYMGYCRKCFKFIHGKGGTHCHFFTKDNKNSRTEFYKTISQ